MPDFRVTRPARSYWILEAGRGELRDERLPRIRPTSEPGGDDDRVLVRTTASGVSRGTEALVHAGRVPRSEYERMRAPFQEGEFSFPVKYGYAAVGVIEGGPADRVGRTVFCLHPHQSRFVVPGTAALEVPALVTSRRAVLAANMETAINVIWDAQVGVGDRVAVVGAGVVGLLVAWLAARIPGTEVTVLDTNPARAPAAEALGVPFAAAADADEAVSQVQDADVVVHASGNPEGVATALRLARMEGVVVEASWFGDRMAQLPLGGAFHARRLTLRASQVGRITPERAPGWSLQRRLALALELLVHRELDVLLTSDDDFDDIVEAMPRALADPSTLCATFRYQAST